MSRQPEAWGGEVHVPRWLRRLLHQHDSPGDTAEAAHEARKPDPSEYARLEHMRAAGTLAPHISELPQPDPKPRRRR